MGRGGLFVVHSEWWFRPLLNTMGRGGLFVAHSEWWSRPLLNTMGRGEPPPRDQRVPKMDAQRPIYPQKVRKTSVGQFHGGPCTSIHRFGIEKARFAVFEVYVTLASISRQLRRRWNIGNAAILVR